MVPTTLPTSSFWMRGTGTRASPSGRGQWTPLHGERPPPFPPLGSSSTSDLRLGDVKAISVPSTPSLVVTLSSDTTPSETRSLVDRLHLSWTRFGWGGPRTTPMVRLLHPHKKKKRETHHAFGTMEVRLSHLGRQAQPQDCPCNYSRSIYLEGHTHSECQLHRPYRLIMFVWFTSITRSTTRAAYGAYGHVLADPFYSAAVRNNTCEVVAPRASRSHFL